MGRPVGTESNLIGTTNFKAITAVVKRGKVDAMYNLTHSFGKKGTFLQTFGIWENPTVPICSAGLGWVKGKRVSSFSREESFNSDVGVAVALPPAGRLSWTWWQPHGGDGGGGAAPNGGSL